MTPESPALVQLPKGNRVYLTFDDGPDARWTPRILDILAKAQARATFFVVGRQARGQAALVRRIAAQGHEIGNHTWSHRHPWTMLSSNARREVRDGAAAIADILGYGPRFFRPPHGCLRRCMIEEARALGQAVVLWSLSAVDWGVLGTAAGVAARLDAVQDGDIVLMHDGRGLINRPWQTASVLPVFLDGLRQRGLRAERLD